MNQDSDDFGRCDNSKRTFKHLASSSVDDDDTSQCPQGSENGESLSEEDSAIVYDWEEDIGNESNGETKLLKFGNTESPPNMHKCTLRRHSLDDSSIVPTSTLQRRRSSLQMTPSMHLEQCYNLQGIRLSRRDATIKDCRVGAVGVGSQLFVAFLQEEMRRSHLKAPGWLNESIDQPPSRRASDEFVRMGSTLRHMADDFASSDHRQRVREGAERVSLEDLDVSSFTDLLVGMFQHGGVTCERVLVLFVFCTDLALRALREHLLVCFTDVMRWSQHYIESSISPWVQRHGGWAVLLERSVHEMYKAAVIGACVMSMVALWTYIRTAGRQL